jgi:hypothetical protein
MRGENNMPDFPKIGGATASEVWAYATRTITDKADFALSAASRAAVVDETWDEAQSQHVGVGTFGKRLDADMTTRSSHAAADIWTVAARTITALTGTPRTDLLGEDASFEAGTGTRKSRIDRLANIEAFDTPIEGTITLDGTEQNVVLDEVSGNPSRFLEGHLDLNAMASGDTVVVRQYISLVTPVAYRKYAEETYTGAQSLPLLHITSKSGRYGIKVTVQRTAGTVTSIPYQFFRRRIA